MNRPSTSTGFRDGNCASEDDHSDTSSLGGIDTSNILNKRTRGVKIDWKKVIDEEEGRGIISNGDSDDDQSEYEASDGSEVDNDAPDDGDKGEVLSSKSMDSSMDERSDDME